MESCVCTTSSEDDNEEPLFCEFCKKHVASYNSAELKSHITEHLQINNSCGNFLYFRTKKMPILETPKSRNFKHNNIKPRRSRTLSGQIMNTKASQTSPRPPHFIHEPSPCSSSSLLSPVHKYHMSKLPRPMPGRVVESEPTKNLYSIPLKSRKATAGGDDEEKETLLQDKELWFQEAEFQVLSKLSDVECPKCLGRGPFISAMKSTGNVFCLSSCLATCLPFLSCCLSQPSFDTRICCSRCKHLILEFDSSEPWLSVK